MTAATACAEGGAATIVVVGAIVVVGTVVVVVVVGAMVVVGTVVVVALVEVCLAECIPPPHAARPAKRIAPTPVPNRLSPGKPAVPTNGRVLVRTVGTS
jgi:hypothetical protein